MLSCCSVLQVGCSLSKAAAMSPVTVTCVGAMCSTETKLRRSLASHINVSAVQH